MQGTLFLPMRSRLLRTALGNNGARHEVPFLKEDLKCESSVVRFASHLIVSVFYRIVL